MAPLVDVRQYGALGDGTDCTAALSAAIAAAGASGATVHVPHGGTYLIRPLVLTTGITLQVDGLLLGATGAEALRQWPRLAPLPTYGRDRDYGAKAERHQALISVAPGSRNVVIRGKGTIDGRGSWWWDRREKLTAGRPHLIEAYNVTGFELRDLTLRNSPFWTVHPVYSSHVHVHRVTIRAPLYSPNTDGVDPDSCKHVMIELCDIAVGDDHVAIKSGMNELARSAHPQFSTTNVTVRRNIFRAGMGVAVGSETAGGVANVTVEHNTFWGEGWSVALHVKTAPQRGNTIEHIMFRHNTVYNTSGFMRLATFGRPMIPTSYLPTAVRSIAWMNNTYTGPPRRVRSKWICPSGCTCEGLYVVGNTQPTLGKWQCDWPGQFVVEDNLPQGLEECMKQGSRRRGPPTKRGAATETPEPDQSSARRGPRQSRHSENGQGRRKSRTRKQRFRKFHWKTGTSSWSTEAASD